ncbi:cytochrome P450 [Tolypothrix campylonemoides VB511288]|nr:cytochrome P450 [Tolypothrix campylonemoides VB511288]
MKYSSHNLSLSVPGPNPLPVFGRAINTFRFTNDSIKYTHHLFQTYGPIVSLAFGGGTNLYSPLSNCPGTVFIYGPELIRQVTTQDEIYYRYSLTGKFYGKRNLSARTKPLNYFGVGLFGENSDQHRQHRRLLMPAFHKQRIESYRNNIVAITQSVLDQMQVNEHYDIAKILKLLTMQVSTKTLLGYDIGEKSNEINKLLRDCLNPNSLLIALLPFDLPGLPYHRFFNMLAQFDHELRNLIMHKRHKGLDDGDILSMLIQARDAESGVSLSEDELLGHTSAIFAAGYDTSSHALTWTLFLLSQHPHVAADLLDELENVLYGEAPTLEQLQQLPFLEQVIKESMRILPPIPWNVRVTAQPTELGGYALPKGTEILMSVYHTHHMSEIYPQPEVFHPQRWQTIQPTVFEYNSFGSGQRICIGAAFAMMEMKIILAILLQRYRLQCIPSLKVDRQEFITLAPKYGMTMTVHKQDRQFHQGVGGIRGNVREMVKLT